MLSTSSGMLGKIRHIHAQLQDNVQHFEKIGIMRLEWLSRSRQSHDWGKRCSSLLSDTRLTAYWYIQVRSTRLKATFYFAIPV